MNENTNKEINTVLFIVKCINTIYKCINPLHIHC